MKKLIAGIILALAVTAPVLANTNLYDVTYCTESGRGPGDLVSITREGIEQGAYVQIIGLDRKPTTYILVKPGETWQVILNGDVIASETVDLSDCGGDTTTTVPVETTTTTEAPAPPPEPEPPVTTTTMPDVTTTTVFEPNPVPGPEGCPTGMHDIGGRCAPDVEGG